MSVVNTVTFVLVVVGALNWGLVGLAEFDLVATLFGLSFGQASAITRVIYTLVGVSALYQLFTLKSVASRRV
jgi:uncharacterized membrane protein YuzA (DUF378 family)